MMKNDYTKGQKKALRQLAGEAYEKELAEHLAKLEAGFADWRSGKISASELDGLIHQYHKGPSKMVAEFYNDLDLGAIVGRAVVTGYLADAQVPPIVREIVERSRKFFEKMPGEDADGDAGEEDEFDGELDEEPVDDGQARRIKQAFTIKLDDLLISVAELGDEETAYLDTATGRIIVLTEEEFMAARDDDPLEDYPEWQRDNIEIARRIEAEDPAYVELPSRFDIHEHHIMKEFCLSLSDPLVRNTMCNAIRGKGAFGRFRDGLRTHNLLLQWEQYRTKAIKEQMTHWLRERGITVDFVDG